MRAYFFKGYMQDIRYSSQAVYKKNFDRPNQLLNNCGVTPVQPDCDDILFHLQGDENYDSVFDESQYDNFVQNNGVQIDKDNLIKNKPSLKFTDNNYLHTFHKSDFNFGTKDFTIDFWFKLDEVSETESSEIFKFYRYR